MMRGAYSVKLLGAIAQNLNARLFTPGVLQI
jgi:hypothetical protein